MPESKANEQQELVPCISCAEDIRPSARVCRHCDSYQSRLKNLLRTLLPYVGAAIALAAYMTSVWTTSREYFSRQLREDHLALLALNSSTELTILNNGRDDALVMHLNIVSPKLNFFHSFEINAIGRKDTVLTVELEGLSADGRIVSAKQEAEKAVEEGLPGYMPRFYLKNSPPIKNLKRAYAGKLPVFEARATIASRSLSTLNEFQEQIQLEAILVQKSDKSTPKG